MLALVAAHCPKKYTFTSRPQQPVVGAYSSLGVGTDETRDTLAGRCVPHVEPAWKGSKDSVDLISPEKQLKYLWRHTSFFRSKKGLVL